MLIFWCLIIAYVAATRTCRILLGRRLASRRLVFLTVAWLLAITLLCLLVLRRLLLRSCESDLFFACYVCLNVTLSNVFYGSKGVFSGPLLRWDVGFIADAALQDESRIGLG